MQSLPHFTAFKYNCVYHCKITITCVILGNVWDKLSCVSKIPLETRFYTVWGVDFRNTKKKMTVAVFGKIFRKGFSVVYNFVFYIPFFKFLDWSFTDEALEDEKRVWRTQFQFWYIWWVYCVHVKWYEKKWIAIYNVNTLFNKKKR